MSEEDDQFMRDTIFTFIWSFKKGDNILYNFAILRSLYRAQEAAHIAEKSLFNKPIIVIIVAIIECLIADFIDRVKEHRREKVPNLTDNQIHAIRYKEKGGSLVERQMRELTHFIDQIQKHNLFGVETDDLYEAMHYFRRVRNRIHIQNSQSTDLPADEDAVFTKQNLDAAQRLLKSVIETMFTKYYRQKEKDRLASIDVRRFPYPWLPALPLDRADQQESLRQFAL
jgi:hypothetical protein